MFCVVDVVVLGVAEVVVVAFGVGVEAGVAFCQVYQPALSASSTEEPQAIAALYLLTSTSFL